MDVSMIVLPTPNGSLAYLSSHQKLDITSWLYFSRTCRALSLHKSLSVLLKFLDLLAFLVGSGSFLPFE